MTREEKNKIIDENYLDLVIRYTSDPADLEQFKEFSPHIINDNFAVLYLQVPNITIEILEEFGYSAIPKCYGLTSEQSLDASGVTQLRNIPVVNLRGEGVVVAIIDTGIDYTNPVFQRADGTTKIISIWDQTIDSENEYPTVFFPTFFGTEYTMEQINQALESENPLQIVPSMDENGHGTKLAGIAAGSEDEQNNFSGVAPDADLIIVKLKQAKRILTNYYAIPDNVACYQENDIAWAVEYVFYTARKMNRPISICIGLGTSQGAHDNTGFLNSIVSVIGDFPAVCTSVSAGNEGNARRHFYSVVNPESPPVPVELNVGENESGFTMDIWGEPPVIYSIDILSPTGEYIPRLYVSLVQNQEISFLTENTIINIEIFIVEIESGKQVIRLRYKNPTPGIWLFKVYGRGDLLGNVNIWLPSGDFISRNTYFIQPDPYITITSPGNSIVPITVTAYDSSNNRLYVEAGKGFSTSSIINPDLAAPGVNIQCPTLDNGFTTLTGTSAATAHTTGIGAMILEWSIVRNNYPGLDTVGIKKFLIRGAKRSKQLEYPNRDWGYGIIDVYNSFNLLRTDIESI
jgi:subtilisin family serine protease